MWSSCGALVVLTWLGLVPPAPGLVSLIRAYIFSVINLIDILCWATKCHKMPFSLSIIFIPFRGIFSKLFQHNLNRRDEDQRSTVIPIRDLQYQKIFGPSYVLRYWKIWNDSKSGFEIGHFRLKINFDKINKIWSKNFMYRLFHFRTWAWHDRLMSVSLSVVVPSLPGHSCLAEIAFSPGYNGFYFESHKMIISRF